MLLMGDVDVNEADPEGNTALHWCLSGSSSTQEPRYAIRILFYQLLKYNILVLTALCILFT